MLRICRSHTHVFYGEVIAVTDIEKQALELIAEIMAEQGMPAPDYLTMRAALIRALEQHEAFRQEVSDAIDSSILTPETEAHLTRFIIAKPDPLVEVINDADDMVRKPDAPSYAEAIRAALAARGLKIVEVGHD